ncbi:catalase family peroxidase [Pseudoalteromonas sp. J010]|uniref:catalase family peroxidase n=1 Tax=Pseudoalteromonas sp. J010 TaxID=998465 RepID=UPI0023B8943A|nr:catalase family peroxidase [Pseudoalteromonas sp. J010]
MAVHKRVGTRQRSLLSQARFNEVFIFMIRYSLARFYGISAFVAWYGAVLFLTQSAQASTKVTAQQFVDLQQGQSHFPGFRRAHAKGVCVSGEFISNGSLTHYSDAEVFSAGVHPFIGRFSIAGNNPHADELSAPVRSFALSFVTGSERWNIAMNTPPVMAVSNPYDFYQQLVAIKQGGDAIKAFFAKHPESADFLAWKASYTPTESLALETYHSINAFYLHDAQSNKQAVRWQMLPLGEASKNPFTDSAALQKELAARIAQGNVRFTWQFTLAAPADDENNPAIQWPSNRAQVNAGEINITQWQPQLEGACHAMNFDPLILPTGLSATADPILRARSAAYAESYRRRAKEQLIGALGGQESE